MNLQFKNKDFVHLHVHTDYSLLQGAIQLKPLAKRLNELDMKACAITDYGNMFGVDNDADKPGEKERLVYIIEQSDSGWRCSWQYHTAWNPWMTEGRWQMRHDGQPLFLTPPIALSHDGPPW